MSFKIAVIVDAQVDFMDPNGALFVPGADALVPTLDEYLSSLTLENGYMGVVFTADTHDEKTYPDSEEAQSSHQAFALRVLIQQHDSHSLYQQYRCIGTPADRIL